MWRPWLPGPKGYAADRRRRRTLRSRLHVARWHKEDRDMWRMWLLFDPRRTLVALFTFLFALALLIHFILLSTDRFNWLEGPTQAAAVATSPSATDAGRLSAAASSAGGRATGRSPTLVRCHRLQTRVASRLSRSMSGGSDDGDAQFRKKIPRARRNADRRRSVRLLGRAVLRRLLRRHDDLLRHRSAPR